MSNRCLRRLAAFVAIVYLCIPGRSQSLEISTLKGELRSDAPLPFHEFWVELAELNHLTDMHRTDVRFDGSFQFRDIRSGQYSLRVTTLQGELVHQELVTVTPQAGPLTVRLGHRRERPLRQARFPYRAAAATKGIRHWFPHSNSPVRPGGGGHAELEKAIRISPEYADAYNNLAVQHIRMGRFEDACDELAHAIDIAGPNAPRLANLAFTQRQLNRNSEAIASARAAVRLDSSSPQANLILGSLLAVDPNTRTESIPLLERAAETLPSARAILETVRRAR